MKKNVLKVIIALVFLAVFNVLYFLATSEHTPADWVSYAFIHAAYLCLLATPLFGAGVGKGLVVLKASLWARAIGYFFVELIVGAAFLLASPEGYVGPLAVQVILLAIFLIMQLMSVLANDSTTRSIRQQRQESAYLRDLKDKLKHQMRTTDDPTLRQILRECHEALACAPLPSSSHDDEQALRDAVDALCLAIEQGDTSVEQKARQVILAVQKRRRSE